MKLYVVVNSEHGYDDGISGIFSTPELAEQYIRANAKRFHFSERDEGCVSRLIDEFELDVPQD